VHLDQLVVAYDRVEPAPGVLTGVVRVLDGVAEPVTVQANVWRSQTAT
jgi:hypothetical protein